MKLNITWKEELVTARTHSRLLKEAAQASMEFHRDVTMPQHFTPAGAIKYGFAKRAVMTQVLKARKYHHQLPNVMTGAMRGLVRVNSKVTRTQYGARLYVRNYFPLTEQRRREMEIVTQDEEQAFANRMERSYGFSVRQPQNMRKRRVKIKR